MNMNKPRYLTKSRFKLAIECPTKLYYTGKKEYLDQKMDDSFLAALAEGGFQVGELAKCYFPGGHDIMTLDYTEAEQQTNELMKQSKVTIFEPAIRFESLFIRIDVLIKNGNHFDLIEVKAKSFDNTEEEPFLTKKGTINSGWKSYLNDVAFQKYVLSNAFPKSSVNAYLMLTDKNIACPVSGLNQKFKITRDQTNRKGIKVSNTLTDEDLQKKILIQIPVDFESDLILDPEKRNSDTNRNFVEEIEFLSSHYEKDEKLESEIGSKCRSCEFKCTDEEESQGYKNGFKECWSKALRWKEPDFCEPNVLEIWNSRKKDQYIEAGKVKMSDLCEDDISPKEDSKGGISPSERQWLQIEKSINNDTKPFFDKVGLKLKMDQWIYPLHFIDFETSAVAIPFTKGRSPYEGIAFQFSHHIMYEDGTIEHAGQFLNTSPGVFPNFEFIRQLKGQLENDEGTIFRYAAHENTYLNLIYRQMLKEDSEVADKEELCRFIKSITSSVKNSPETWEGERNMVDLCDLVKRYYYDPQTNGSNSIKHVLPAILNSSDFVKSKYSKKIYGSKDGIKSLNFPDWQWIAYDDNGKVIDPYKKLPKLFQDSSDKNNLLLTDEDELNQGGAALTAYGRMQFTEMSEYERNELSNALLRYCELDTFAMVMIVEAWMDWINTIK
jgi:hypothetical protein